MEGRYFLPGIALLLSGLVTAPVVGEPSMRPATVPSVNHSHVHTSRAAPGVDSRVELLAKELKLDHQQQTALRAILVAHRAEVARVWDDATTPAGMRVGATQAISERTADRIRELLTDEQREKYAKTHQHEAPVGSAGGDVQKWMKPDRDAN